MRVAEVELVRSDRVALAPDAEQLAFDRVEVDSDGSIGSAKIASSDSSSRSRGPTRSTGVSFMPSGIQRFVTHGVPSARPIAAAIRRHACPCAIQKSRIGPVAVRQREVVGGASGARRTWD